MSATKPTLDELRYEFTALRRKVLPAEAVARRQRKRDWSRGYNACLRKMARRPTQGLLLATWKAGKRAERIGK